MKLELKHINPYRPYRLNFIMIGDHFEEFDYDEWDGEKEDFEDGSIWEYCGEVDTDLLIPVGDGDLSRVFRKGGEWISINCGSLKPILRPMSDLNKKEYKDLLYQRFGGGYASFKVFESNSDLIDNIIYSAYISLSYDIIQFLSEHHFDFQGLINEGLAVNLNPIKQ